MLEEYDLSTPWEHVTGILNSGIGNDSTGTKVQDANRQMVTWADVVRKPAVLHNLVEKPRKV